jgi:hypothetical protein
MIEALSVLLLPPLDIFVLGLRDNVLAYTQHKKLYSTNHPETSGRRLKSYGLELEFVNYCVNKNPKNQNRLRKMWLGICGMLLDVIGACSLLRSLALPIVSRHTLSSQDESRYVARRRCPDQGFPNIILITCGPRNSTSFLRTLRLHTPAVSSTARHLPEMRPLPERAHFSVSP